jgi:hypothetical protein
VREKEIGGAAQRGEVECREELDRCLRKGDDVTVTSIQTGR